MTLDKFGLVWLVVYLFALIVIAIIAKRKETKSKTIFTTLQDFYVAAKSPIGIPVLIFTFSATLFSAFFMVGLPGFIYTHGLVAWPYIIFGDVLGMLGLFYIGKKIIERRREFGSDLSPLEVILPNNTSKIIFIVITSIFILPYLGVQISGFGKLLESATEGKFSMFTASLIGLLIIYIYSLIAGVRGIAFSDFFQGLILFICAFSVGIYITFWEFSGPIDLVNNVETKYLSAPGGKGVFGIGALISGCILFASIPISQPQFLTRYLLISNKEPVKYLRSIAIGMGLLIAFCSLAVLPIGLGGTTMYPEIAAGDSILGKVLSNNFPAWFGGLFTVGVLAAAMSTADSILFSLGQIFSRDIYKGMISPNASENSELVAGKTFILIIAIVALLVGVSNSELIVSLSSLSFAGTLQLVPAVIGGLFITNNWKHSATVSMVTGISVFVILNNLSINILGLNPAIPAFILASLSYYFANKTGMKTVPNKG